VKDRASNHLLGLIVGLAVAAHRRRARADVELFDARRDLRVLALEQAVAGKVALDQEWPEVFHVKHPHRYRVFKFAVIRLACFLSIHVESPLRWLLDPGRMRSLTDRRLYKIAHPAIAVVVLVSLEVP
jgi:hypothetical protein